MRGLLSAYLYSLEKDGVAGAADAAKWLPGLVDAWNGVLANTEEGAEFAIGPRFFLDKELYKKADVAPKIINLWRVLVSPPSPLILLLTPAALPSQEDQNLSLPAVGESTQAGFSVARSFA